MCDDVLQDEPADTLELQVKLVLKHNKFYVESKNPKLLIDLMHDPVVQECVETTTLTATTALKEHAAADLTREDVYEPPKKDEDIQNSTPNDDVSMAEEPSSEQAHAFEIKPSKVNRSRCTFFQYSVFWLGRWRK